MLGDTVSLLDACLALLASVGPQANALGLEGRRGGSSGSPAISTHAFPPGSVVPLILPWSLGGDARLGYGSTFSWRTCDAYCASFWLLFCSQSPANTSFRAPASALKGFVSGEGIWLQGRAAWSCSGDWGPECDGARVRAAKGYKTFIFSPFAVPLFFMYVYAK